MNEPNEAEVIKIIEAMGTFMKQTNEMLAQFKVRIDNQQVDIEKLKKKSKDNGKLIVRRF